MTLHKKLPLPHSLETCQGAVKNCCDLHQMCSTFDTCQRCNKGNVKSAVKHLMPVLCNFITPLMEIKGDQKPTFCPV